MAPAPPGSRLSQKTGPASAPKENGRPPPAGADTRRTKRSKSGGGQRPPRNEGKFYDQAAEVDIKDKDVKSVLAALAKQVLMNTQDVRKLKAAAFDMFVLSKDSTLYQALTDEYQRYLQMAKESSGDAGPPWVYQWPVLVAALQEEDIGGANKKEMANYSTMLEAMSTEEIGEKLQGLYMQNMYNSGTVKLYLALKETGVRNLMVSSLKQMGAKHHPGQAPAGFLERRLSQMLECMEE